MSEEVAHPRTVRLVGPASSEPPAPIAVESLRAGAFVGGYELVRPIAKGATGAVFLARDLKLGRRVAIKFLISSDGALARRFLLEAQATARCVHENIVVIHEVGSWQGIPFLVLEYLDGPALSAVLAGAPLPLARCLELIVPVVRALQCAHSANIVHRDLKPDNIIVTRRGAVKVVDFGIAKAFRQERVVESAADSGIFGANAYETLSGPGLVVGTLPYMAPEQWRGIDVDARCDLFAVGVILYRMLTGKHPSGTFAPWALREVALSPQPYPSISAALPELPQAVAQIVDRCLQKHPTDRHASADELLAELEALSRQARRASTTVEECPYPGLAQFTMHDAARYFGRGREITAALAILGRSSVLTLVGPSGSGKSSLALAGVAPSLRDSRSDCKVIVMRPGRMPLASLLEAVVPLTTGRLTEERLRAEPGALGVALREACYARGGSLLLVVDQFEEVFTLTAQDQTRQTFLDALLAAADDVSSPIRLALTLRSDFLHRVAEHSWLTEVVGEGMLLLTPPDRSTLRAALVRPLAQAGYELEDEDLVEEILHDLEASTAPLPLLQLVGTQLWSHRDRKRRCLSRQAYRELGGVHGALAGQADAVLAGLSSAGRKLVRAILLRLVTSAGTRAVVERADLLATSPEAGAVLSSLVQARLVVVNEDDATVELIHEALIEQWPALRGWIQESREDFALRDRLVGAARQWAEAGCPAGLLWTGDALADVRALLAHEVPLGARERAFVAASTEAATRASRRRRWAVTAALVALALVAGISIVALAAVRRAEGQAREQAVLARGEAQRALAAERSVSEKVAQLERKERERLEAESAAARNRRIADQRKGEVERSQLDLEAALANAQAAQRAAELSARQARDLATKERAARDQLQQALARERDRVEELRRQRSKIEQRLQ
ncbi:MAG: protein kinase [Myxococcales bacterium]|nr:protein kinase [Myxococcales bacterium]